MAGRKYVRVVETSPHGTGRCVYCFVDTTNGDVLKSASWKGPAKGARGNIYSKHHGLEGVTAYGGCYNR